MLYLRSGNQRIKVEVLSLSQVLRGKTGEMPALRVPPLHPDREMQGWRWSDWTVSASSCGSPRKIRPRISHDGNNQNSGEWKWKSNVDGANGLMGSGDVPIPTMGCSHRSFAVGVTEMTLSRSDVTIVAITSLNTKTRDRKCVLNITSSGQQINMRQWGRWLSCFTEENFAAIHVKVIHTSSYSQEGGARVNE